MSSSTPFVHRNLPRLLLQPCPPAQHPHHGGLDALQASQGGAGLVLIDSLSALHAGVKASQGSFSLPFDGWLLQGGEARSIEAATVAGDIRTLLNAIVGFEGEAKITPDGLCPHGWVEGLSITGEA
jgi:PmbA protein